MILNQSFGGCQYPRLVEPLRRESPPLPSHTIRSERQASAEQIPPGWADEALAETAPPRAASFGALRSWSRYVVLASLEEQPRETVEAIRAALVRRLKGYGLGKVETALLMDMPIPPPGNPVKGRAGRARRRKQISYISLQLPDPFKARPGTAGHGQAPATRVGR